MNTESEEIQNRQLYHLHKSYLNEAFSAIYYNGDFLYIINPYIYNFVVTLIKELYPNYKIDYNNEFYISDLILLEESRWRYTIKYPKDVKKVVSFVSNFYNFNNLNSQYSLPNENLSIDNYIPDKLLNSMYDLYNTNIIGYLETKTLFFSIIVIYNPELMFNRSTRFTYNSLKLRDECVDKKSFKKYINSFMTIKQLRNKKINKILLNT